MPAIAPVTPIHPMLTTREAASRLACSPHTVRRLIRSGELEAVAWRRRGHLRIEERELARFLEANRMSKR